MYFTDVCLDRCDPRYQRELAEQAGARLASAAGSKAWSAVLPLVGAAISGAIEGASAGWFVGVCNSQSCMVYKLKFNPRASYAAAVARRAKEAFLSTAEHALLLRRDCSWCAKAFHHKPVI